MESDEPKKRELNRPLLGFLIFLGGLLLVVFWGDFPNQNMGRLLDRPAPEIDFEIQLGENRQLSDFRGSVVLINFWASWCEPCVAEMPSLKRLEDALSERGLVILAFNVEGKGPKVLGNLPVELEIPSKNIFVFDEKSVDAYQVRTIPQSVVVDRQGVVRYVYLGPRDWMHSGIRKKLEELLN